MFKSVLIANRGEIACRIARTAKRLGLRVIAVYSQADAHALHVRLADEAHAIGPAPAAMSYLVIEKLIQVAKKSGAECIHPGYGFLSENAAFAEGCAAAGLVFVGPPPQAIRAMGLKDRAKALMVKAGVPVVPGYHGELQEAKFLKQKAYEIGYPVLIKAVAGGGGKGMRRVDKHAEFDAALAGARREAASAFGDERVLVEKCIAAPRHIEMQIFADRHGNAIHLQERDCSLQRRHQKVIEEAPAPGMTAGLREAMGAAAVAAAKAVGYVGAGTVEFIADGAGGLKPGAFWFMEMNTRLQVEHPVTEMVTGVDIVREQIRVAAGLTIDHLQVSPKGYAMEVRVNAEKMSLGEDGKIGFTPSPGKLARFHVPPHPQLRIISAVEEGSTIPPYYDSLIVQIVAHGESRAAVIRTLREYLGGIEIEGVYTNLAVMEAILDDPVFNSGDYDTKFLAGFFQRANLPALLARIESRNKSSASQISVESIRIENSTELKVLAPRTGVFYASPTPDDPPFVELGAEFNATSPLCLMEAMKVFEHLSLADYNRVNGQMLFPEDHTFTVTRIMAESGQTVNQGDLLFVVKPIPPRASRATQAPTEAAGR
jgi:3-methylcrotonyl-CoA carboxylase alpha subunit